MKGIGKAPKALHYSIATVTLDVLLVHDEMVVASVIW
jgi:hypothetical protein